MAATSDVRDWHTKLREVLRCQAVQALIHRHAQLEGDWLRNVQPMQFVVEDVHQTPVELPSTSGDTSGGVQDPLQLVSRSSRRVREQCVVVIYPTGHERVD